MKTKYVIQATVMLALLLLALLLPAYAIADNKQQQNTLQELVKALEAKRIEHHIPGMAIAIVKDNEIILSKGFGLMDVAAQKPVETNTLFAIGSTSKAFTATLIAQAVDQGQIKWDDEIIQYLPTYQFKQDGKKVPITFRDALSHRTGYTRNDLLWANGQASRELILATAAKAEPWDDFRAHFHYNNIMYLAAGEAAAQSQKKSWDSWLQNSLLTPLGMNNTTSIHQNVTTLEHVSKGYLWNEQTETFDWLPARNLNNVAPAGGIYSNVEDMALWVKFLLNKGQVGEQTLVSKQALKETQTAQIKINSKADYGMGWFLQQWHGQPVIEHGGSIDGYAAQVALLPESNLGFVLLSNVTATPLQQASMNIVWEHLVEPVEITQPVDHSPIDYQEFIGEYHADFGPFNNAMFNFLINENGHPAVDVPGQTVYELKNPDQQGKWYFAMTDTIAISFDRAEDGSILAMRLHQNRLDFELPRKGVNITPEIDEAALKPFLGQYQSKVFKGEIKALIKNHRLAIDVPNEMIFELHLPDADGHRQFRIKSDMSAVFEQNEQGQVTALSLYRDKTKRLETALKTDGESIEDLPTVAEIMKLRNTKQRLKSLQQKTGFQLTGSIHVVNSGIKGTVTTQFDDLKKFKQHLDFGVFGEVITVTNEQQGATYGINPYTELLGPYLKQIRKEHPASMIDWPEHYDSVAVMGSEMINKQKVYAVRLSDDSLPDSLIYIDAKTGDIVQYKTKILNPVIGGYDVQITYHNYEEIEGLRIPFHVEIKNPMMGQVIINYQALESNVKFDNHTFSATKP